MLAISKATVGVNSDESAVGLRGIALAIAGGTWEIDELRSGGRRREAHLEPVHLNLSKVRWYGSGRRAFARY